MCRRWRRSWNSTRRSKNGAERILGEGLWGTKALRLEEERSSFLPLPGQECEARRITLANANSLSLVQFDTNRYSLPAKYAHRTITVVATVDGVKLEPGARAAHRLRRCRQDASGDRSRSRGMWPGTEGAVRSGNRTDHAAHGGQGGEAAPPVPQADQAARPHRS